MDIFHPCDPAESVAAALREPTRIPTPHPMVARPWRELLDRQFNADMVASVMWGRDRPLLPVARRGLNLKEVRA